MNTDSPYSTISTHNKWTYPLWFFVAGFMLCFVSGVLNLKFDLVPPAPDFFNHYRPVSEQIQAGQGPTTADGRLATRVPPVYPYLLAACISASSLLGVSTEVAIVLLQSVSLGACSAIVFLIATIYFSTRTAVIAAALTGTYPLLLYSALIYGTEATFTALLLFTVYHISRLVQYGRTNTHDYVRSFGIGVLNGLLILVRPIALILIPAFIIFLFFHIRQRMHKRALIVFFLITGYLVPLVPWEIALYVEHGAVIPVTTGGPASLRDGWTFGVFPEKGRSEFLLTEGERAVMLDLKSRYSELTSTRAVAFALLDNLFSNPLGVVTLVGHKVLRAWYGTDSGRLDLIIGSMNLFYAVFFLLGLRMYFSQDTGSRTYITIAFTTILPFWFMTFSFLSIVRYMLPVIPLLLIVASLPIQALLHKASSQLRQCAGHGDERLRSPFHTQHLIQNRDL